MDRKEFEEQFGWMRILSAVDVDALWLWIEQQLKDAVKESHKCMGCETLIHYQYHCSNCKRLLET